MNEQADPDLVGPNGTKSPPNSEDTIEGGKSNKALTIDHPADRDWTDNVDLVAESYEPKATAGNGHASPSHNLSHPSYS
jgi:hypothetical protein